MWSNRHNQSIFEMFCCQLWDWESHQKNPFQNLLTTISSFPKRLRFFGKSFDFLIAFFSISVMSRGMIFVVTIKSLIISNKVIELIYFENEKCTNDWITFGTPSNLDNFVNARSHLLSIMSSQVFFCKISDSIILVAACEHFASSCWSKWSKNCKNDISIWSLGCVTFS